MNKIILLAILGLLILETYGASYRNKRQADEDDKKDNKLDNKFGVWNSFPQYPNPGWNNGYPGQQPWGQPQYPYPMGPQYPYPGQPQYPYPGVPGGQPWYPGQPAYPGQPWLPGQTWLPGTVNPDLFPTGQPIATPTQAPTESTDSTTGSVGGTLDNAQCIQSCPVTSEYNPVCGTNNVTYPNPGRLECAKFCGTNVELARKSRCPAASS